MRKGNFSKSRSCCKQVWQIHLQIRVNLASVAQGIILSIYWQFDLFCIDCCAFILEKGRSVDEILIFFFSFSMWCPSGKSKMEDILIISWIVFLFVHWINHICCLSSNFYLLTWLTAVHRFGSLYESVLVQALFIAC